MLLTNCPVCENTSFYTTNISMPEGSLKSCNLCSQLISQCTKEQYDTGFLEFNTEKGTMPDDKNKKRSLKRHEKFLSLAMQYVKEEEKKVNILDVGCSSGSFLQSARTLGFENLYGVEPAKKASDTAKQLGFNITCGTISDVGKESFFNIITILEVIEHLEKPVDVLRKCHKLLSPYGVLLIGTGNANSWTAKSILDNWEYFSMQKHGGHISFFNPESIEVLAKRCGFQVEKILTRAVNLHAKYKKNSFKYKFYKILSEFLNVPARFMNKGHDMLVILTKKK